MAKRLKHGDRVWGALLCPARQEHRPYWHCRIYLKEYTVVDLCREAADYPSSMESAIAEAQEVIRETGAPLALKSTYGMTEIELRWQAGGETVREGLHWYGGSLNVEHANARSLALAGRILRAVEKHAERLLENLPPENVANILIDRCGIVPVGRIDNRAHTDIPGDRDSLVPAFAVLPETANA